MTNPLTISEREALSNMCEDAASNDPIPLAAFIYAARTAVPRLLADLEAKEKRIAELEQKHKRDRELLRRLRITLLVPSTKYVLAITDAVTLIEEAMNG